MINDNKLQAHPISNNNRDIKMFIYEFFQATPILNLLSATRDYGDFHCWAFVQPTTRIISEFTKEYKDAHLLNLPKIKSID